MRSGYVVPEHSATPTQYMELALKRVLRIFLDIYIRDHIWENQPVSEKNKFLFYCFVAFYVERRCRRPNLKPIRRFVVE